MVKVGMYRKAALNDSETVYRLICDMECKQIPYDRFHSIYQKQIKSEHYYCLVCEHDNDIIGILNLRFEEQPHHSECIAEIMEFAVDKTYRKQGIGKEMFVNACQLAKILAVHKWKQPAINFGKTHIDFT